MNVRTNDVPVGSIRRPGFLHKRPRSHHKLCEAPGPVEVLVVARQPLTRRNPYDELILPKIAIFYIRTVVPVEDQEGVAASSDTVADSGSLLQESLPPNAFPTLHSSPQIFLVTEYFVRSGKESF